jgi:hypothetical protein
MPQVALRTLNPAVTPFIRTTHTSDRHIQVPAMADRAVSAASATDVLVAPFSGMTVGGRPGPEGRRSRSYSAKVCAGRPSD